MLYALQSVDGKNADQEALWREKQIRCLKNAAMKVRYAKLLLLFCN